MGARSSVVRPFDPWRSPLCTCPRKYSLNPYTGCSHFCLYCYATSYIGRRASTPKRRLLERLTRDLESVPRGSIVEMSSSSDPYPPVEAKLSLTRAALKLLAERGYRVLITTKGSLVARDWDLLLKTPSAVMVTVTTLDSSLARIIEPGAPNPRDRLEAVASLSERGIPVGVRVDPLIPFLNDDEWEIRSLLEEAAAAGAKHIVTSTYKARPDNLRRMAAAFPELADAWYRMYKVEGEWSRGYWYLPARVRRKLLEPVVRWARRLGLTVAHCREGHLGLPVNAPSCDGSHLIHIHPLLRGEAGVDSRGEAEAALQEGRLLVRNS